MVRAKINQHNAMKQRICINSFNDSTSDKNESKSYPLEDNNSLDSAISQHHFVTKVHVVVPSSQEGGGADLLPELSTLLTDSGAFIVKQLPLDELVSYNFIQGFIKSGEVQCLSEGTLLGSHDCAALHPSGRLSLLLSHHTYHALGLTGAPVTNILRKPYHRYAVHVNSLSPGFHPPRPGYERTVTCLRKLKMDVRLVWEPHSASVCPSSLAKYFSDRGYDVQPVGLPSVEQSCLQDVEVPLVTWRGSSCLLQQRLALGEDGELPESNTPDDQHQLDALDFLESVGCLLLDVKPVSAVRRSGVASVVSALHCDGAFSTVALRRSMAAARSWLLGAKSRSPWVCLSFHCHPEAPFEQRGGGRCSKTQEPHCGSVSCGCGSVESDQHCPGGRLLMVVLTPSGDDCWFQCGSAGVRHRYYPKTSNNK